MLNWIIDTSRGSFEADSLDQAKLDIISYYVDRENPTPHNIIDICGYNEDGELMQKASYEDITKFYIEIEEAVREQLREIEMERRGDREIERDYYNNLI